MARLHQQLPLLQRRLWHHYSRQWRQGWHLLLHYWAMKSTPPADTPQQAAPAGAPVRSDGAVEFCLAFGAHNVHCRDGHGRYGRFDGAVAMAVASVYSFEIQLSRVFGNSYCCRRY